MTTRGLEDLDGGLGSCLPSDDFPLLEEPRSGRRTDGKARGASRPADSSSWTHVLQDTGTAGAAEKELAANECPGTSKGMPKAGTNAVAGEVAAPQQWVPPSPPPKKPEAPASKPPLSVPPSGPPEPKPGPPGPQAQKQDKSEATEAQGEPGGSIPEASGEERAPLGDRGSQERPRKEKPRTGEKLKKEKPRREKPRREERPRATRELGQSLSRRWDAREGGHRPWTRDSRELEHEKRQAWAPRRRRDRDNRPRQKPRGGKGRD
ncbi:hypothetical protein A6R68_08573, partial [Neotoma lepida]